MMGGGGAMGGDPTFAPPGVGADGVVSAAEAERVANEWLRRAAPDSFPGYYTLHVRRDDGLLGMVSVNASTGAVWYQSWHGRFVSRTRAG